eukprot:COSAG01_NODE_1289_length_10885_cov_3.769331_9_plen_52_part_00
MTTSRLTITGGSVTNALRAEAEVVSVTYVSTWDSAHQNLLGLYIYRGGPPV